MSTPADEALDAAERYRRENYGSVTAKGYTDAAISAYEDALERNGKIIVDISRTNELEATVYELMSVLEYFERTNGRSPELTYHLGQRRKTILKDAARVLGLSLKESEQ